MAPGFCARYYRHASRVAAVGNMAQAPQTAVPKVI
jgi:hypothetical protein